MTLNFPKRSLYLRLQTPNPRSEGVFPRGTQGQDSFLDLEAIEFLEGLRTKGRLPGFLTTDYCVLAAGKRFGADSAPNQVNPHPVSRTFSATKERVRPNWEYHYTVVKEAKSGRWRLTQAWRTDAANVVIEEFPIRELY